MPTTIADIFGGTSHGTVTVSDTETVGTLNVGGISALTGYGSVSITSGAALTVTGTMALGTATGNEAGTVSQGGGTVSAATEWIGQYAPGGSYNPSSYTQTGGTNTVSTLEFCGTASQPASTQAATYNLNGGTLNVNSVTVNNNGYGKAAFNFGGGTLQAAAPQTWPSTFGTFALSPSTTSTINSQGNTITFNQALTGSGALNIAGSGSGSVVFNGANSYTGTTTISSGTLDITGASNSTNLLTNAGGVNITGGQLILDYTTGSDPASLVNTLLASAYSNGFHSGQIYDTSATASMGLGWIDNTTTKQITIMPALYGDADLNGKVDLTDFSILSTNFNPSGTGMTWQQGDFDYNGKVDLTDFSILATNFTGDDPLVRVGSAVPEPSSIVMLALLLALGCIVKQPYFRRVSMKRFLVLGVCIVLSGAFVANANATTITINDTDTGGVFSNKVTSDPLAGMAFGTIDCERTSPGGTDPMGIVNSTAYDEINLFLTGFNSPVNGYFSTTLGGQFTASTGATLQLVAKASSWAGQTTNGILTFGTCFVNFDNSLGTFARGAEASGSSYDYFSGNWGTTTNAYVKPSSTIPSPTLNGADYPNNLLAELFITPGAGVSYAGELGTTYAGGAGVPSITFTVAPVPEPGTLALLAAGLAGLLCYAWRKR